ncbi:hypothetical protein [Deinococcus aquaticus]|uniref:HTH cro/C1-type domain-containing protein n=1 Tax=Deinococcus aquaticus TaxID=328692 RepID=A0ABY7V8D4_9DEIO|nr:hypothetical protein [Deinococcus aquaticus]WDA60713.1 hypothetical protein M8445_17245 [Deinococcus aquaticus]
MRPVRMMTDMPTTTPAAPPDRDQLIATLTAAARERAAALGLDRVELARRVHDTSEPTSHQISDLDRILNGRRLGLLAATGLKLLDVLGLQELRPVWGPVDPGPSQRAANLSAATDLRLGTDTSIRGRLTYAAARRAVEIGMTREELARRAGLVDLDRDPPPPDHTLRAIATRYMTGRTSLLTSNGLDVLRALGLVELQPVWRAPRKTRSGKA